MGCVLFFCLGHAGHNAAKLSGRANIAPFAAQMHDHFAPMEAGRVAALSRPLEDRSGCIREF